MNNDDVKIECPRVARRMECRECGYPYSEAFEAQDDTVPHFNDEVGLILWLQKQPGWIDYSGDASVQAAYPLPNGMLIRVGVSDAADTPSEGFWVDLYEGLRLKGSDED